jgi:hypothetical protein
MDTNTFINLLSYYFVAYNFDEVMNIGGAGLELVTVSYVHSPNLE